VGEHRAKAIVPPVVASGADMHRVRELAAGGGVGRAADGVEERRAVGEGKDLDAWGDEVGEAGGGAMKAGDAGGGDLEGLVSASLLVAGGADGDGAAAEGADGRPAGVPAPRFGAG